MIAQDHEADWIVHENGFDYYPSVTDVGLACHKASEPEKRPSQPFPLTREWLHVYDREMYYRLLFPILGCIEANYRSSKYPLVVGVTGGPGAGKTTLANTLTACLKAFSPQLNVLNLALEDFYFSEAERLRRGLPWRALPGTHDVDALVELLRDLKVGLEETVMVPRFNMQTGEADPPEIVQLPVSICVVEGWLVGHHESPYDAISKELDALVYLDAAPENLRKFRLGREWKTRVSSNGQRGMSSAEIKRFWQEALEPGLFEWVIPIRAGSDLIVSYDDRHQLNEIGIPRRRECRFGFAH